MKQYQNALKQILENGVKHSDRTGVGTISLFGEVQMVFDLQKNFPIVTTKRVPLRWIFEELMWFINGHTHNQWLLDRKVDIWNEWATTEQTARFGRSEGDLGPVYGYLWRSFGGQYPEKDGVDQIAWLLNEIKTKPNSRRLIVSGWDPATQDTVALPPCHTLFQFKVEEGKYLSCKLYQRSADFFLGVPFNISSYALLTYMIAEVTGLIPKRFIHTFGDAHIYNNHMGAVEELLSREPKELPTLNFKRSISDILDFKWDDIELNNYEHHPKIEAPVAI